MDDAVLRLTRSFRRIWVTFGVLVFLTCIAWLAWLQGRSYVDGLLLGQVGGAYVIFSMIRQGHLRDGLSGKPLLLSGMLGMFSRYIVLILVMVIAIKTPPFSPYTTLIGYLLGLVVFVVGMAIHERTRKTVTGKMREESR